MILFDLSIVSLDTAKIGHPSVNNLLVAVHMEVSWPS